MATVELLTTGEVEDLYRFVRTTLVQQGVDADVTPRTSPVPPDALGAVSEILVVSFTALSSLAAVVQAVCTWRAGRPHPDPGPDRPDEVTVTIRTPTVTVVVGAADARNPRAVTVRVAEAVTVAGPDGADRHATGMTTDVSGGEAESHPRAAPSDDGRPGPEPR